MISTKCELWRIAVYAIRLLRLGGRVGCVFSVGDVSVCFAVLSSWLVQTLLDKINSKL